MLCWYQASLLFIFAQVVGRVGDSDTIYHFDVDAQLGAYESTFKQSRHSHLVSLDWNVEDCRLKDVPADHQ